MNPISVPKRNVCRYFAAGGSCFYGDACQFQHVLDPPGVQPGAGMMRGAAMASGPPTRSQSAGPVASIRPSGVVSMGRGQASSAAARERKRPEQPPFSGPHRMTRSVLPQQASNPPKRASNPPKHRMGGGVSRTTGSMAVGGVTLAGKPTSSLAQKRREELGRGGEGGGPTGITTLQPPPASKAKGRTSPSPSPTPPSSSSSVSQAQVQSGGTTYFYSGQQPSYAPDYTTYTKPPTHLLQRGGASQGFFLSEELHQELYQRQLACLTLPASEEGCPKEVDSYHSLCPLEPVDKTAPDQESKRTFGHASTCYRAVNQKDGLYYCLRRIHGCRLTSTKAVQELDKWKQLEHVNLVTLRKMFTTKAFGDHSVVLVYDYHPAAKTLKETHFKHSKRTSPLPEELVWDYVVQLASALRLVHSNQLALSCLDSSKVIVTGRHRLRVSCSGVVDILTFDTLPPQHSPAMQQQGDLFALGQLLLCVSLQSSEAGRPEQLHRSLEVVANTYSPELNRVLQYLLHSGSKGSPHTVLEVMSMSAVHLQHSVERALHREDILEMELSKEVQNGRLVRILAKLGSINERPEFAGDQQWAETGDRYLLKLFRDYLFHQILPNGAPWVNLAHIVQTLNKLDAGTYENVALHSRDEQSVLVVSYADLKQCLEKTFSEVLASSGNPSPSSASSSSGALGGRPGSTKPIVNGHSHGFINPS